MAQAMLSSPSSFYSPPTSPYEDSDSFSSSPNLPTISSPFLELKNNNNKQQQQIQFLSEEDNKTPTKSNNIIELTPIIGNEQPSWVTDELDQEWVEEEEDEEDEEQEEGNQEEDDSTNYSGSPTITKPPSDFNVSQRSKSRILSSTSTSFNSTRKQPKQNNSISNLEKFKTTTTTLTDNSNYDSNSISPDSSPNSMMGTFVIREDAKSSVKERPNHYVKEGENQLQAAIRALKGPSSGLGAAILSSSSQEKVDDVNEGEMETPQKGKKSGGDRLGGLMNLFKPLTPPLPLLPSSTIQAPSIDLFTFSPPIIPNRTSWKSLPHFSPADVNSTPKSNSSQQHPNQQQKSNVQSNNEITTPTNIEIIEEDLTTPMRNDVNGLAPPIKLKERYLRSSNITESTTTIPPSTSSTSVPSVPVASLIDIEEPEEPEESEDQFDDFITPFPTTPAPQAIHSFHSSTNGGNSNQNTPRSSGIIPGAGLRLFEFKYDTFTTDHLAALVDEIDGLGREGEVEKNLEDQAWETSFVDVPVEKLNSTNQQNYEEEEEENDNGEYEGEAGRSSKRIRLSPPSAFVTESSGRNNITRSNLGDRNGRLSNNNNGTNNNNTRNNDRRYRFRNSPSPSNRSITSTSNVSSRDTNESLNFARSMNGSARRSSINNLVVPAEENNKNITSSSSTNITGAWNRTGEAQSLMDKMRSQSGLRSSVPITTSSNSNSTSTTTNNNDSRPQYLSKFAIEHTKSANTSKELTISAAVQQRITPPLPSSSNFQSQEGFKSTPISALRKAGSITTIGPEDIIGLLASTSVPSRMVFDKELSKWIKSSRIPTGSTPFKNSVLRSNSEQGGELNGSTGSGTGEDGQDSDPFNEEASKSSEDPFRDFDNSRNLSDGNLSNILEKNKVAAEERFEINRHQNTELGLSGLGISAGTPITPFVPNVAMSPLDANYFDNSPVERSPLEAERNEREEEEGWGDRTHYSEGEDASGNEQEDGTDLILEESPYQLFSRVMESESNSPESSLTPNLSPVLPQSSSPDRPNDHLPTSLESNNNPNLTPRPIRATSLSPSNLTSLPRSALKPTVRSNTDPGVITSTPISKLGLTGEVKAPRSVSFSDGKSTGQIDGLVNGGMSSGGGAGGSRLKYEVAREDQEEDEDLSTRLEKLSNRLADYNIPSSSSSSSMVVAQEENTPKPIRNQSQQQRYLAQTPTYKRTTSADATFLTEASFTLSRDNLVRLITDVEPGESDWDEVRSLNLAGKGVESLIRLKDFLPRLDEADFTNNQITFLTGIPDTVRTLLLSSNKISSFAAFSHLRNLERIDLSNNNLDSLFQLASLKHLRELKADNNQILDLSGIDGIDGLLRLSLKNNLIETVDFGETKWSRLETLNLSRNRIISVNNINKLQSLSILNLDHNRLENIGSETSLPRLRVLRLCNNPIQSINIAFAPKLRTCFVDGACLGAVEGTSQLRKLENLSVRDQNGAAVTLIMKDVRDVKRLYLSGNALPLAFPTEQFFNLVYLELAMCQLTSLPANLASLIPNVRVLNLNFNFIDDLTPLTGLSRINKLTVLGARLEKCRPVAKVIASMPELELLDLRLNPFTLPFYPPLILQHSSEILAPHSEYRILHPDDDSLDNPSSHHWPAVDQKFRKALPDLWYFKRMTYRAVLMETSKSLICLDGIDCSKERLKSHKMLSSLSR